MSISMQKFLDTPVHQGARQAALVAYRVAEGPEDGSGLTRDQRLKAILDVHCAIHAMMKGPVDAAAAEAERLWDTALSPQQKRMIAASPAAAPMIVADAIKQDAPLAAKTRTATPGFGVDVPAGTAGESFFDRLGRDPFDRGIVGNRRAGYAGKDNGARFDSMTENNNWGTPAGMAEMRKFAVKEGVAWVANNPDLLRLGPSAIKIIAETKLSQESFQRLKTEAEFKAKDVVNLARFARDRKLDANQLSSEVIETGKVLAPGDDPNAVRHRREFFGKLRDYFANPQSQEARQALQEYGEQFADDPEKKGKWDKFVKKIGAEAKENKKVAAVDQTQAAKAGTQEAKAADTESTGQQVRERVSQGNVKRDDLILAELDRPKADPPAAAQPQRTEPTHQAKKGPAPQ